MITTISRYFNQHFKIFLKVLGSLFLLMITQHIFAGTTTGDLSTVDSHVHTEVTGDVLDILAWVSFAMGCITAVTKMSMAVVITMFSLFLVFILGPTVISAHFTALI